jgi:hypothetical protein
MIHGEGTTSRHQRRRGQRATNCLPAPDSSSLGLPAVMWGRCGYHWGPQGSCSLRLPRSHNGHPIPALVGAAKGPNMSVSATRRPRDPRARPVRACGYSAQAPGKGLGGVCAAAGVAGPRRLKACGRQCAVLVRAAVLESMCAAAAYLREHVSLFGSTCVA